MHNKEAKTGIPQLKISEKLIGHVTTLNQQGKKSMK